jgi:translation initiation factor 1
MSPWTGEVCLRIERAGRGGKTVTIIEKLPKAEALLEDLSRKLKTRCGSGGTYRWNELGGVIEIQGDRRDLIRKILDADGIKTRG